MDRFLLGFDIGGTKCAAILGKLDAKGELTVIDKHKVETSSLKHYNVILDHLVNETKVLLKNNNVYLHDVAALGISCGGPLDSKNGIIQSPPNLPGWDNVPVVKIVSDQLHIPVRLQNDANAGAVAEWKYGAGKGADNLIFLTFGTGMGSGLILNGRLYSGNCDLAGECGHIRLADFGPAGFGKAGSFEGFCSGGGIAQYGLIKIKEAIQNGVRVPWFNNYGVSAKEIGDAAEAGDALAVKIYSDVGGYLGRALSVMIDILNPDVIVIGSIFARSEKFIRPAMAEVIAREAIPAAAAHCRIVPAKLGEAIGDIAALSLAAGDY